MTVRKKAPSNYGSKSQKKRGNLPKTPQSVLMEKQRRNRFFDEMEKALPRLSKDKQRLISVFFGLPGYKKLTKEELLNTLNKGIKDPAQIMNPLDVTIIIKSIRAELKRINPVLKEFLP